MSEQHPPVEREPATADRYGPVRTPAESRRRRIVAAVVAATVGLGAMAWLGSGVLRVPVRTQEAGFAIIDDGTIDVTFLVVRSPGTVAQCRVHALNPSFAEVGAIDVTIPPSTDRSVQVTVRVATSERATTGLVQSCRVVESP